MPPAWIPHQDLNDAPDRNASLSQRLSTLADVAKKKKAAAKDASRPDNKAPKAETPPLPLIDDLPEPSVTSPAPEEPPAKPSFALRALSNTFDSPVLDALGSLNHEPDVQTRTDTWARSVPFGKSPPNDPADNIGMDESPPNFASIEERAGSRNPPQSVTPSQATPSHGRPRPLSYAAPGYSPSISSRHPSGDRQKRYSMSPQYSNQPPPPHLPQAHFFRAPDVDIGIPVPGTGRAVPEPGYSFCALGTLPHALPKSPKFNSKVLTVGYNGSLEILALENGKSRALGRLDGLCGRVIEAKFLTWTSGKDPFAALRPLIAVTLHGPVASADENGDSSSVSDQVEIVPAAAPSKQDAHPKLDEPPHMQTRVQVYSLRTQELLATLFATKPAPILDNFLALPPTVPPPAGNLRLYASGNSLVIASGTSGEVFIYGAVTLPSGPAIQCFGKVWTGIQPRDMRRSSNSSNSTDQDDLHSEIGRSSGPVEVPILSLSGRWLAVVSPSPTRLSLHGIVPATLTQKRPYGIDAYTPPSRPSVTCAVDSGDGESLLNKVARGVTQELFRGARWIGDQGMQSWNNYWNKDSQTQSLPRRPHPTESPAGTAYLPPTHAHDSQSAPTNEPDQVSIFDLKHLEESADLKSTSPTPIATFQPPNGCSYLSLAPTGLMLLTASRKGDVQYIWDLMQIRHCRARAFLSEDASSVAATANPPAAHVRLVARYGRLTTSSILDVIWTTPKGDQLAIVTKKGTVHVYGVPPSAFQWPPLRRLSAQASAPVDENPNRDETIEDAPPANPFSAAVKLVGGTTQPILAAVRGRAPSVGAAFAGATGFGFSQTAGVSVRGSKAVAAGLSKSVGAATNTLRHVGENRLHLAGFARGATVSRAAWLGDETAPLLGIVDSGYFKVYHIRPSAVNGKQNQLVIGPKAMEIQLPAHARFPSGPQQPLIASTESNVSGFWSLPSTATGPSNAAKLKMLPLSQAEIETNAPYQPFHTDRRVTLKVYPDDYTEESPGRGLWVFGNEVPAVKVRYRSGVQSDEDDDNGPAARTSGAGEMENLISLGNAGEDVEHIVITTRRKKRGAARGSGPTGAGGDEDGFFEDDCEVLDFARDRV